MKEIKRQIKERSFYKVYLLTGDENYLLMQAKQMLKAAMIKEGDEMNYTLFEDSKVDMQQLGELAMTYPFFSEKRLLVLDRTGILKSGKEALIEIMEHLPETTCMVICEPEIDKRSKAYKWIKKNGYIAEFLKKNQTEKVLLRWVATLLSKEKKKIRESDAGYFLERVGDDMFQIKNETEKLISYVGERTEIVREDIEAIASGEIQNKIFDMVSAIARGDKTQALDYYNDLILLKEPPMHILFLIIRQYRILLMICNMRQRHKPDKEIAQAAGIPTFAIRKNESQLRGYNLHLLENCILQCIEMEEQIKTGKIGDQMAVELLIVGLSERNL
ncbi:MAG: DNA polymerase III subunit delta [Lachnospiraceae bacterium]|nr:DNA polymerase III subunit delta [Lachnospiraceae bacterium]